MTWNNFKEPLYRKVNTKARGVHHLFGGDFKDSRNNTESFQQTKGAMFGKQQRGLDYTPLFKFLLSRVGSNWDEIFSEAKSRLDKTAPIFWVVALHQNEKQDFVRIGASSYFSGMFVDDDGNLQLCNPNLKASDLIPACNCCTHTFNGEIFGNSNKPKI